MSTIFITKLNCRPVKGAMKGPASTRASGEKARKQELLSGTRVTSGQRKQRKVQGSKARENGKPGSMFRRAEGKRTTTELYG